MIVNATNHKDLEYGAMSRELIHKAGRDNIVREYLHMYPDGIGVCDVAVTQPGKLKCQYLFHGCLFGWIMNGNLSVKVIEENRWSLLNLVRKDDIFSMNRWFT